MAENGMVVDMVDGAPEPPQSPPDKQAEKVYVTTTYTRLTISISL